MLLWLVACTPTPETVSPLVPLVAPAFLLEPSNPKSLDDIEVVLTNNVQASTSEEIQLVYRWTKEGDDEFEWSGMLLPYSLTSFGDVWTVEVWAENDMQVGQSFQRTVDIENTAPLPIPSIEPLYPRTLQDVQTRVEVSDPDEQEFDLTYQWKRNGELVPYVDDILLASMTEKGEMWTFLVSVHDTVVESAAVEYEFYIENTAPVLGGITVFPNEPNSNSTLSVSIESSDVDSDELSYRYKWFINGAEQLNYSEETLPSDFFNRGDEVFVKVQAFDGDDISDWKTSLPVEIKNAAPTLESAFVVPEEPKSNQVLLCSGVGFSDNDGDPEELRYEWISNGTLIGEGEFLDLGTVNVAVGELVSCIVYPNDGMATGTEVTATVEVINSAPVTYTVDLTPASAYEGDEFSCTPAITVDIDGTTVFDYTYQWFINGVEISEQSPVLDSFYFDREDSVLCGVIPSDGVDAGDLAYSNAVVVSNSIPTAQGISITPSAPTLLDTLECELIGFSDADQDIDQSIFTWKKNGQFVKYSTRLNLDMEGALRTDTFTCEVTLYDGIDTGGSFSESVGIANYPPTVTDVQVSPADPTVLDTIASSVSYEDIDGDLVTLNYIWLINNQISSTSDTELSGEFVRGDTLRLMVTPFDGAEYGSSFFSDTLTVANSIPSSSAPVISPSEPTVMDTLLCSNAGFSDADADPDQSTFRWLMNGAAVGSNSSLDLQLVGAQKSDVFTCEVTPYDGIDSGEMVSEAVTVINNPPLITQLDLDPLTPKACDTIQALVTASDPDGDAVSLQYTWLIDGAVSSTTTDTVENEFERGQTVQVVAKPNDGIDFGTEQYSTVLTVVNSPPEPATVALEIQEDSLGMMGISCAIQSDGYDCDGDDIEQMVSWYCDGTLVTSQSSPSLSLLSTIDHDNDTVPTELLDMCTSWSCEMTPNDGLEDGSVSNTVSYP